MEDAKLATGSTQQSSRKGSTPKKSISTKSKSARPGRKNSGAKSKSERLVCRYCGSDDLAPSFIKRRDRRCRKCFSKRYRSALGGKKTIKNK
jgi:hypothetical protein